MWCETEPDTADLPKPLNFTFLLSPDILIRNTFHFVRGQLLADKDMKGGLEVRVLGEVGSVPSYPCAAFLYLEETEGSLGERVRPLREEG